MSLLEVSDLVIEHHHRFGRGRLRAVDGVSFRMEAGEYVGLVGESGCGKSTLARAILGFEEPVRGFILLDRQPVQTLRREGKAFRRRAQLILQDTYGSLNPRMTAGETIDEVLKAHRLATPAERSKRVRDLLEQVGLDAACGRHYPHELSGGQRQRVCIARALALNPELLVADEPVSALDVSVQAQVLNVLRRLRAERGVACLLISHDLAVVRHVCERVLVMCAGRIVEEGPTDRVFNAPEHPYTRRLLAAAVGPLEAPGSAGLTPVDPACG